MEPRATTTCRPVYESGASRLGRSLSLQAGDLLAILSAAPRHEHDRIQHRPRPPIMATVPPPTGARQEPLETFCVGTHFAVDFHRFPGRSPTRTAAELHEIQSGSCPPLEGFAFHEGGDVEENGIQLTRVCSRDTTSRRCMKQDSGSFRASSSEASPSPRAAAVSEIPKRPLVPLGIPGAKRGALWVSPEPQLSARAPWSRRRRSCRTAIEGAAAGPATVPVTVAPSRHRTSFRIQAIGTSSLVYGCRESTGRRADVDSTSGKARSAKGSVLSRVDRPYEVRLAPRPRQHQRRRGTCVIWPR